MQGHGGGGARIGLGAVAADVAPADGLRPGVDAGGGVRAACNVQPAMYCTVMIQAAFEL